MPISTNLRLIIRMPLLKRHLKSIQMSKNTLRSQAKIRLNSKHVKNTLQLIPNFTMPFLQKNRCSLIDFMHLNNFILNSKILSRSLSGTKFLLPLFILFCFASCKKEGNIGTNVQASDELIDLKSKDLFPITYTMREDSVRSDLSPIIQIGNIYDPIFGKSTAALFTQLVIPNNLLDLSFGAGAQLDSTFLSLSYNYDFYGDTLTQQTFNVYQMIQNIYYDTAYYSNHPKQYYPC